ncbi:hypothetical protein DYB35_009782, partial [Aphanomyces astaci]
MGKKERQQAVGRTKKGPGKGLKASFGKGTGKGGNAFDVQKNSKSKYEVLGKRVKGQGRNVAAARADAEERRRSTLLKQFQGRKKNNEYKDRRLGEQNEDMSLEDKMIARFQTERKRQYQQRNAAKFNLNDDGESDREEELLTHRGSKIDDFDNIDMAGEGSDDDEDRAFDHKLGRDIVNQLHFGGGGDNKGGDDGTAVEGPERKKTHEEIMQEVMMKSKMFKAEKQKNKATQDETTEQLDAQFADFQALLEFRPKKEDRPREKLDEFDKMTRELAMEAKAKATERKLSPEELAKKEHDKLADLEKKRVARMNGEDEETNDKANQRKHRKKHKAKTSEPELVLLPPKQRATDDSLVDDFQIDDEYRQRVQGENDSEEEEDEEDEDEEDEGEESEEADEESEVESEAEEESEESEEESEEDEEARAAALVKRQEAANEMPFVFPCPESAADLSRLFAQYGPTVDARSTIVSRIRAFYSPKLHADNPSKMKTFFAVLVRTFLKLASNFKRNHLD